MLNRYDFEEKISSGKFAKVYKAYDKQNKCFVAIKCMKKVRVRSTTDDIDISKETDIHKKLKHPFIPEIIESFEEYCECNTNCKHFYYIVMQHIDGLGIIFCLKYFVIKHVQ